MSDTPWLTIIGIGEDGVAGLSARSQAALRAAEVIMAPPRHLDLLGETQARTIPWPVPYRDGLDQLKTLHGQRVVVLASGDPFWFGAGSVIAQQFEAQDWVAHPGPSCFALAANRLGWALDKTACLGLHAAPMARLRRHLARDSRVIVTLRDGSSVSDLTGYLIDQGFGDSMLSIFEHLGGPQENIATAGASALQGTFDHPVCAAIHIAGPGQALTVATGQSDDTFEHDGQITKRPVRAITLSTLAPKPGEHLWDIGGGSGSIALEWLLAHASTRATCVEPRTDRAARIAENGKKLGVESRLTVVTGAAPEALTGLDTPDAIFVGGGLDDAMLDAVMDQSARLVINAVTLEGEARLAHAHTRHGGALMRIDIANAKPLGAKRGWAASYPVVQWSLIR
ncbi:precorrin-6y C5,15-methyltransferase (decarboxylating) subunit CbiE [Tateyamaria armeniaca]|uniref:Precorrin-6y C5,15-methyltransferase (Decarboxylating) subunit CbiE n=1 Tax=Tateyamaria armeniaca TaxID=2518930 RepID=A0ABW8UU56_9RHOB